MTKRKGILTTLMTSTKGLFSLIVVMGIWMYIVQYVYSLNWPDRDMYPVLGLLPVVALWNLAAFYQTADKIKMSRSGLKRASLAQYSLGIFAFILVVFLIILIVDVTIRMKIDHGQYPLSGWQYLGNIEGGEVLLSFGIFYTVDWKYAKAFREKMQNSELLNSFIWESSTVHKDEVLRLYKMGLYLGKPRDNKEIFNHEGDRFILYDCISSITLQEDTLKRENTRALAIGIEETSSPLEIIINTSMALEIFEDLKKHAPKANIKDIREVHGLGEN